jgi:16S rRNA (adenine1518-N6/adenine1519-N6)-dimethyltransferase
MNASPRKLLSAQRLRAKAWLGQNFLTNPKTAEKIVRLSGICPDDTVLEIGPGLGALTLPMARIAEKIYAVEKDQEIIPLLAAELASEHITNVDIIAGNILHLRLEDILSKEHRKVIIMGNLPYNISSQVLIQLIHARAMCSRAVLMFQKELARRISAEPGNKDYGRITVALRYCADIRSLMQIDASQFFPKPKVDSEIVEIRFKPAIETSAVDEAVFFSIVKAAFSKRRKTLKNSLFGSRFFEDAGKTKRILESVGIDPIRRAETLSVDEFVALSNAVTDGPIVA